MIDNTISSDNADVETNYKQGLKNTETLLNENVHPEAGRLFEIVKKSIDVGCAAKKVKKYELANKLDAPTTRLSTLRNSTQNSSTSWQDRDLSNFTKKAEKADCDDIYKGFWEKVNEALESEDALIKESVNETLNVIIKFVLLSQVKLISESSI